MTVHKIYYFIYFEDGVVSLITNGENIMQKGSLMFPGWSSVRLNRELKQTTTATATRSGKTKDLIGRTITQHVRFKTLYIS